MIALAERATDPHPLSVLAGLVLVAALIALTGPPLSRAADHLPAPVRRIAAAMGLSDAHPD